MRAAWTTDKLLLAERMKLPAQVEPAAPEAEMPAYMESFLAHLRLLVGVPFDYLVPDARLLPDETIRFFYLDRSWTDRLVDGAVAVGKVGTREQAHHQAHHPEVQKTLDRTEYGVRDLQRARLDFLKFRESRPNRQAGIITGFLLRSGAVSGWPHMDVRAYDTILPANFDPEAQKAHQLTTLRLERLAPAVLIALFEGVPKMVICEEPHHGIQFGVHEKNGVFSVFRRNASGIAIDAPDVPVPMRNSNPRVLGLAALRRSLQALHNQPGSTMPAQTGAANFAVELLSRPWRQRFQGSGGKPDFTGTGAFVASLVVAPAITQQELHALIKDFVK
jgi:hypothetical protein